MFAVIAEWNRVPVTSHFEQPIRTIQFSDRVSCPKHGPVMVLVRHELSDIGRRCLNRGSVTFYRCTAMETHTDKRGNVTRLQCTYCRANKYQRRAKGERHK